MMKRRFRMYGWVGRQNVILYETIAGHSQNWWIKLAIRM